MLLTAALLHPQLPEAVRVTGFDFTEGLSQLFRGEVAFTCEGADLALDALVGTDVTLVLLEDGAPVFVRHGVVESAARVGRRVGLASYRLCLRPRLVQLAHRVRSRMFQGLSAQGVVDAVLAGAGVPAADVAWELQQPLPARELCTQWKESELAFVLRLLEEEGVFFAFAHTDAGHVLRLHDSNTAFVPLEGGDVLQFSAWEGRGRTHDTLARVTYAARAAPDAVALRDWDWESPERPVQGDARASDAGAFEAYDFPQPFADAASVDRLAAVRLAQARVHTRVLRGLSDCPRLAPGRTFTLAGARPSGLCRGYVLTALRHRYVGPGADAPGAGAGGHLEVDVEALPDDTPYAPPRVTPRPRVTGKEVAVVTGPPGEEIHVDNLGRVKVLFKWDREGKPDDSSSVWLRVQQQNTATSLILPRVGWEVSVGFLYGDPDRPVVLQKLYNAHNLPPYALPDNLMQASLQTSSTPGGGGTNELRLNDGAGGMELFLHAQKDLTLRAGHNRTERVANDETVQVGQDCNASVGATEQVSVAGSAKESVTGARVEQTAGNKSVQVGALDDWGVSGMHALTVQGARTDTVGALRNVLAQEVTETLDATHTVQVGGAYALNAGGPLTEAVAGNKTELVGGAKVEVVKGAKAENIGAAKALTAGAVKVKTGKDLTMTAGAAMALTTGGPVAIKVKGDFTLTGKKVTLKVGKATLAAGAKLTLTPGSLKVKGRKVGGDGAQVKLKGTIKYK